MSGTNAWLLDFGIPFGIPLRAAIGARELVQILDDAATFTVPFSHAYSRRVLFWQKRMLPVMDMAIRLGAMQTERTLLAVVGYQGDAQQPAQFGALVLAAPPVPIAVSDEQACSLTEQAAAWRALAISCFEHERSPIPVLHLERIFGGQHNSLPDCICSDPTQTMR